MEERRKGGVEVVGEEGKGIEGVMARGDEKGSWELRVTLSNERGGTML